MYWSQWNQGLIERASMDGTNRTVFVYNDLHWPGGLTIDYVSDKLYWCDSYVDRIERINLDGTNRTVSVCRK